MALEAKKILATRDDLVILNDKVVRLTERNESLEKALENLKEMAEAITELDCYGYGIQNDKLDRVLENYEIEGFAWL